MGAESLASFCAELEASAKNKDLSQINHLIQQIETELPLVRSLLVSKRDTPVAA